MSKRAEEAAFKAYPDKEMNGVAMLFHEQRRLFQEGYELAEKDLIEWVEEQLAILDKQTLLHPDDNVFWGQRNAYKQMKDKLNSL